MTLPVVVATLVLACMSADWSAGFVQYELTSVVCLCSFCAHCFAGFGCNLLDHRISEMRRCVRLVEIKMVRCFFCGSRSGVPMHMVVFVNARDSYTRDALDAVMNSLDLL